MRGDRTANPKRRSTRYRRLVVDLLCEHTTLTVADLADEIAAREHDASLDDVEPTTVADVYFELCETHLPTLARASLVSYDAERELVSRPGYGTDVSVTAIDVRLPSVDESNSS
ncbi:hypothetical protein SAMN04487948_112114 [Halogranum amylolyticum]|uniref:DUF7344 domain-containing protein n=1 Tax=Halogranum amylolyticum TaxID=660520 RepID=A0A1H8UUH0_9EURY|nr:hypothetical protein [Halogranum amylolyticum]SEP06574.1 hypothetical protein SAMN04487948_112114 [Halogranum amylolyticum]